MGRLRDVIGLRILGKTREEVASLEDIQRRMVQLELQWAETLDFIQHWASRQAKRDQRAVKTKLSEPAAEPPAQDQPPLPVGDHAAVKAELRRRAAALRQGGQLHLRTGSEP